VVGVCASPGGYAGLFNNVNGVALKAAGTGIIQSTAKSYVWISGNGLRKFHDADSTIIDMDTVGGAVIKRGATAGNKNVMLPITITSPLYGQNVKITRVDIYWKGDTTNEVITAILLRRQTRTCDPPPSTDPWCFASILHDTGLTGSCEDTVNPAGCTIHYDLTSNNVLTADSGILYMTMGLTFSGSNVPIWIGGVRLTLEHD